MTSDQKTRALPVLLSPIQGALMSGCEARTLLKAANDNTPRAYRRLIAVAVVANLAFGMAWAVVAYWGRGATG